MQFLRTGLLEIAETGADIKQDKWHVFFADERVVPLDHEDSNFHAARNLLKKPWCTIPDANIHKINPSLSPADCAADYQRQVRECFGAVRAGVAWRREAWGAVGLLR